MKAYDIAIVGAGPAGLAVAAALGTHDVEVALIAPNLDSEWIPNYGSWVESLEHASILKGIDPFARTWPRVQVHTGVEDSRHTLERAYGKVDGACVRAHLLARSNADHFHARLDSVEPIEDGSMLILDDGSRITARRVVDASGHAGHWSGRGDSNPGYQTAYGIEARFDGCPLEGHDMVLMDFRPVDPEDSSATPTFLYGMKLGENHYFVEETVLVGRPPVDIGLLKKRLERRLADRGVRVLELFESERCSIPMGHTLPDFSIINRVAYGGAASMVHPATGYMFSRVMSSAEDLADALIDSLTDTTVDLWRSHWNQDARSARRFYQFGMETLLSFSRSETADFFEAFFNLPHDDWFRYLNGDLSGRQIASIMLKLFGRAPGKTRLALARSALGRQTKPLVDALIRM